MALFRRIVFAAVISGALAGITLTALQGLEVTPLILEAEAYELQVTEQTGTGHEMSPAWAPQDGWERTLYTTLTNGGAGIGFALLLCALFALRERVSVPQGALWGALGFIVFYLNPALGLPPELPGTPAAPLIERQLWWLSTVVATAGAVALLVLTRPWSYKLAGLALLVVPHLVGAPHAEHDGSLAPADLTQRFVLAATWTNGVFWLLLGSVSAWVFRRLGRV
ncbi:MAG: CbtA family protein [Gammaproteobacteria bacterium]